MWHRTLLITWGRSVKNEKVVVFLVFSFFLLSSCRTVQYHGSTATEVREHLGELQGEQSTSAEQAGGVTERSRELAEGLDNLEKQGGRIAEGVGDITTTTTAREGIDKEFEQLLDEIRRAGNTDNGITD